MKKLTLAALALLSLSVHTSFGALVIDFNQPGDLDANLDVAIDSGTASSEDAAAGFSGTRGVTLTGVTRNHGWIVPMSFSGNLTSWTTSALWNTRGKTSGDTLSLGFLTVNNPFFSSSTPATVASTSNVNDIIPSIHAVFAPNGQEINVGRTGEGVILEDVDYHTLTTNTWYRIAIDVNYTGSDSYTVVATTHNVDSNGDATTLVTSSSAIITMPALASDTEVYTYFGVHANVGSLDNFMTTAVPEPHITALLGLFFAGTLLRRKRR